MSLKLLTLFTLLMSLHDALSANIITRITDDDFVKMAASKDYIIILFTSENCKRCEAIEYELQSVKGELEKALDATIGKIYDSKLIHVYSLRYEPALVFLRHGVPLLYFGEVSGDLILHNFVENKEPTVKELNDENFEHLTQATTGGTTGDWYIMFYSKTCRTSRRLTASWEAVGAALRTKMNVARISIEAPGFYTGKRFGISYTPTFWLIHQGHMYTYKFDELSIENMLVFAEYFKHTAAKKIPKPLGVLDILLNHLTEFFEKNDWFLETGLFGILLGLVGAIFVKCMDGKEKVEEIEEEEVETEPEHEKEN